MNASLFRSFRLRSLNSSLPCLWSHCILLIVSSRSSDRKWRRKYDICAYISVMCIDEARVNSFHVSPYTNASNRHRKRKENRTRCTNNVSRKCSITRFSVDFQTKTQKKKLFMWNGVVGFNAHVYGPSDSTCNVHASMCKHRLFIIFFLCQYFLFINFIIASNEYLLVLIVSLHRCQEINSIAMEQKKKSRQFPGKHWFNWKESKQISHIVNLENKSNDGSG